MTDPEESAQRAAKLAEEITAAVHEGRPAEWIEGCLLSALSEAAFRERKRCAGLADERATMWQRSRLNDTAWPVEGREEAQARYKEAVALGDAIRVGEPVPPPV